LRHAPASGDHPLPPDLAADLPPYLREALNHRVRRRILRALNGHTRPQSLAEALVNPGGDVKSIAYHLRVLETCGSVSVSSEFPGGNRSVWRYASKVPDNQRVIAVLVATSKADALDG
jgi:DNA-binding transcriptional ArsR family regulator